jgi:heptosyltransferase-3
MAGKTIILSRTDSIGDVMLTLPSAGVLKKEIPGCRIIFLGKSYTRAVIECCEHVDVFADWDEIKKMSAAERLKYFRSLDADAIVHVFPNKEVARLAKKAGIKDRIGTSHRFFHWSTCNERVNFTRRRSELHEAQLNLKLLAPLGITTAYSLDELGDRFGFNKVRPLPAHLISLLHKDKFDLILHPRSKGSAREWGLDNFAKLISILPQERCRVFVTGTKEDGIAMKEFLSQHNTAVDLTGKLTLDELVSFINASDGLVAASTGPLHIAAALGKRAVGIYAPMRPIHPGRWAPVGKNASYLVLEKECSDCRKNNSCHCIREINAEQVKAELGL